MILEILRKYSGFFVLAIVLILARLFTTGFFNSYNIAIILTMSAILGFLALGETLVIFTRGFDLSVGNVASMSTVLIAAVMLHLHESLPPGLVIAIAIAAAMVGGALIGAINGLAVTYMKVPPFIATMGGMWIAYGFAFLILRGVPTKLYVASFKILGKSKILFLPIPFFTLLVFIFIVYLIFKHTALGPKVYASGGNTYAAYLSGIKTNKVRFMAYVASGVFAAIGGVFLSAFTGTGFPRSAEGYELLAIASVVLGGVSLFGGAGNLWGPLAGVITLQALDKIIVYRGISPFLSQMVVGTILLVAVFLTTRQKGIQ